MMTLLLVIVFFGLGICNGVWLQVHKEMVLTYELNISDKLINAQHELIEGLSKVADIDGDIKPLMDKLAISFEQWKMLQT